MQLTFSLLLILTFEPYALSQTHHKGNPNSKLTLVMFADFQDDKTRDAWATVQNFLNDGVLDNLYFTFRPFPVWYNRQAPAVCLASEAISSHLTTTDYWDLVNFLFNKSNEYSNELSFNKTQNDIYQLMCSYANSFLVNDTQFYQDFYSPTTFNTVYDNVQLAASSDIYSSPGYLVNGKRYAQLENATLDDFMALLSQPINPMDNIDLSQSACTAYWGLMITFICAIVGLTILLLFMCISSRVQIRKQNVFDPAKNWETVTVGNMGMEGSHEQQQVQLQEQQPQETIQQAVQQN